MQTNRIITGDSLEVLSELEAESVHAVVTDPPYGLAFMGRSWDDFEPKEYQEWCENWARRCLRVLKPGGHLLAFSGNRTHHRAFTGIEDAGFEIRDTITWHYGSGFPKASDISKTIDKRAGAERDVVGDLEKPASTNTVQTMGRPDNSGSGWNENPKETAPATPEAKRWDGWKTALKPATEYVVVGRKPFDGATVDCVLEHGTGALNINGCRVGSEGGHEHPGTEDNSTTENAYGDGLNGTSSELVDKGRYPANVVFDERAAKDLDSQTEDTESTGGVPDDGQTDERHKWGANVQASTGGLGDSGGVSRYFYTSKATKAERTLDGKISNSHPTVKPTDLMEWLVKLVSKEGQIVVDPFCGSGTTCKAAKNLNREFVGIERQSKWADVARVRVGLTPDDPSVVRGDSAQNGLEAYTE